MPKACRLAILDEVNCEFIGLEKVDRFSISDEFSFEVPGARHMPSVKLGRWDGRIALFSKAGRTYVNLLDRVLESVAARGYEVDLEDRRAGAAVAPEPFAPSYIDGCLDSKGEQIVFRDYQAQAVDLAVTNTNGLFVMATSSGKSYVCGCVARKYSAFGRVLVIVPNTDLVSQTAEAFVEIGIPDVGVFEGGEKRPELVTISTWQSLENYPELFEGVVCVIVDECHGSKARVLFDLLQGPGRGVVHRYGFTGTLPEDELSRLQIEAMLGPVRLEVEAWQLQEQGWLAKCDIHILQTVESKADSDPGRFDDQAEELEWLTTDDARLRWVAQITSALADCGNTMVLVGRVEAGKRLAEMIGDRAVFVYGKVKNKDRRREYKSIDGVDGKVLICTRQVAGVGVSINRLFNIVLFEIGKGLIPTIQAIGRGLRKAIDKNHVDIYDICSTTKYSDRHMKRRRQLYKKARYPYDLTRVRYLEDTARAEPAGQDGGNDVFDVRPF